MHDPDDELYAKLEKFDREYRADERREEAEEDGDDWDAPDDAELEELAGMRTLAWELYDAQPEHPRIAELAQRALARQPHVTGMMILLALHRDACGDTEEARRLLRELMGRRDPQYLNAVRNLRDLEYADKDYAEALRLTEVVLREDPEADWTEHLEFGAATVFVRSPEEGWRLIDEAVDLAARTDPDWYHDALGQRAVRFLATGAPPERFLPAAEAAIEADPTDWTLTLALAYAYLFDYRPERAEELLRRVLREDPTDAAAQGGMTVARGFLDPIERGDTTIDELRELRMGEIAWRMWRDQMFGTGLDRALAALDAVLPADLAGSLRPPLDPVAARESTGDTELLAWHDGQDPGAGVRWGCDEPFRLMSSAEIDAMEHAIEGSPGDWPQWDAENEYFKLIATDDADAYLFAGAGGVLHRRSAKQEDREVAPSLADWVWDRVAAFGGADARPGAPEVEGDV